MGLSRDVKRRSRRLNGGGLQTVAGACACRPLGAGRLGGLGLFGELFDGAFDGAAGGFVHAVDEEGAVEVIDLVLDAAPEEPVAQEGVGRALGVLVGDADAVGAGDVAVDFGEGQAAFLVNGFFGGEHLDHGVGEGHGHDEVERGLGAVELPIKIAVGVAQVDDAKLEGAAYLLRGEADAAGGVHGGDHVGGESREIGVEGGYGRALLSEHGGVVVNNREGHGSEGNRHLIKRRSVDLPPSAANQ